MNTIGCQISSKESHKEISFPTNHKTVRVEGKELFGGGGGNAAVGVT